MKLNSIPKSWRSEADVQALADQFGEKWEIDRLPASVQALSPKLRNLRSLQLHAARHGTSAYDPKLIYVKPHYSLEQVKKAIELSDRGCRYVMVQGSTVKGFVPIEAAGLHDPKFRQRRCYIKFAIELKKQHRGGPTLADLGMEAV